MLIESRYYDKSRKKDPRIKDPADFLKIAKPSDFKTYLE
jgi:hypothetical protein